MKRKFFQEYVISTKEEAFVILKTSLVSASMSIEDTTIDNLFVKESLLFGRDNSKVLGNRFLVTDEVSEVLYTWLNVCSSIDEISTLEGFDSLDEGVIIQELYEEIVGSSNMGTLYRDDINTFGEDEVSWYRENLLFQKFWDLNLNLG